MNRKNGKQKRIYHDQVVDRLESHLLSKGHTELYKDVDYVYGGSLIGQIDLLRLDGKKAIYYEVKPNFTKKNMQKAMSQLERFSDFCDNRNVVGYYVSVDSKDRLHFRRFKR